MKSNTKTVITPYGRRETIAAPSLESNSGYEAFEPQALFAHKDMYLTAELTYHEGSTVWVVRYLRNRQVIGQALFHARSTAVLMLTSLGYIHTEDEVAMREEGMAARVESRGRVNESA